MGIRTTRRATSRQGASRKNPAYCKILPMNEVWIAQHVVATGHTVITVVNRAIECARLGIKFTLEPYEPKYVQKLKTAHENRIDRYKKIATQDFGC